METKICPYPGLRPFTQEESIFFKGRDLHVRQVIHQLEERKFVLVNGASGDGKSSLVYAGVIPSAKAGFFHAEYNNWKFIDFRPERNPIANLATALVDNIGGEQAKVEEKLENGFASLVNLYKSSPYYIDKSSDEWLSASTKEQKQMRSKAANLFILADQFEEFFTNKENYSNGKPSLNAYTTVNLLLETARLAKQEDLPIYIVFTMRSDFISQCVAFKGLPEFIGFSQFFVPRLKRKELQQVIEEPALLAGGKLSRRLVEILINELSDGFDQLPVLQHCLNSLWKMADNGNIEIDLIHLVKVAGMKSDFLNDSNRQMFSDWFKEQSDYLRSLYVNPSLSNVLNAHANYLYDSAFNHFNENTPWAEKNITIDDAKFIIKTSFQCLTRIDDGRSVRNRMNLSDITNIINKKHITTEIICGVMNVFRLPSNTLIQPFINPNDIATAYLSGSSVWDITHEALIRNWELLKQWGEEEEYSLSNFRDIEVQLKRWTDNDKSDEFLLSTGSLVHFEDWFKKSNINAYWILKYDVSDLSADEKLRNAEHLDVLTNEFLLKSRKNIDFIEKRKRRTRRVSGAIALIVIVVLSLFTYWAQTEKAYAQTQKEIAIEQTQITEQAKLKAESAQADAEQNSILANNARLQSEKERLKAEKMSVIADDKTKLAVIESEKALKEKIRADEQRKIAQKLHTQAELASENAKQLSHLAIAQSISFKANKNYNDPQINMLLAYHAYLLNKNNKGELNSPEVYQGLLSAQIYAGVSPIIIESAEEIVQLSLNKNTLITFSENGKYTRHNGLDGSLIDQRIFTREFPVNQAFIFDKKILLSAENYEVTLCDLNIENNSLLQGHTNYLRTAIELESKQVLITGGRDNVLRVYNSKPDDLLPFKTDTLNSKIVKLISSSEESIVYAASSNGEIWQYNTRTFEKERLITFPNIITDMVYDGKQNKLVIATTEGFVRLVDLSDNSSVELEVCVSKIDAISIDQNNRFVAVASADKIIRVYQMDDFNVKPYILDMHKQRIKRLMYSGQGELFALCDDDKVRHWSTNVESQAHKIRTLIQRDFTLAEWEQFIGSGVQYQKISSK